MAILYIQISICFTVSHFRIPQVLGVLENPIALPRTPFRGNRSADPVGKAHARAAGRAFRSAV